MFVMQFFHVFNRIIIIHVGTFIVHVIDCNCILLPLAHDVDCVIYYHLLRKLST